LDGGFDGGVMEMVDVGCGCVMGHGISDTSEHTRAFLSSNSC
jgi:hypothetical protein